MNSINISDKEKNSLLKMSSREKAKKLLRLSEEADRIEEVLELFKDEIISIKITFNSTDTVVLHTNNFYYMAGTQLKELNKINATLTTVIKSLVKSNYREVLKKVYKELKGANR